jgi:hypothetical protein
MLDLGPRGRVVLAALWIAAQLALVGTSRGRVDGAFGYRALPSSTTVTLSLSREVASPEGVVLVAAPGGEWTVRGQDGEPRRIAWRDRVRDPVLSVLDAPVRTTDTDTTVLARVQAALDDMAVHTPDDRETLALVASVTVRTNGRDPHEVRLASPRRLP